MRDEKTEVGNLPPRWPWLFKLFRWYSRHYSRKHLHAIRVLRSAPPPQLGELPAIMVMNHASWWDPIVGFVICAHWPDRIDYGPIDAQALKNYRFLGRAGLFGVELGSTRGAIRFLQSATAILQNPRATLWIHAQGRFADVRERPVEFRSGVGHLAEKLTEGVIVPVAIEYTFWQERTAEVLVAFGEVIDIAAQPTLKAREWTGVFESALQRTQDTLATEAMTRDPRRFQTILAGRAGVGGIYDWWRRFVAFVLRRPFRPEHEPEVNDI